MRLADVTSSAAWLALALLATAGVAHADIIVVQPDELGDYPTIQAAVDAADPGDSLCEILIGTLGQRCDSPVERATWGGIKGMYR